MLTHLKMYFSYKIDTPTFKGINGHYLSCNNFKNRIRDGIGIGLQSKDRHRNRHRVKFWNRHIIRSQYWLCKIEIVKKFG